MAADDHDIDDDLSDVPEEFFVEAARRQVETLDLIRLDAATWPRR